MIRKRAKVHMLPTERGIIATFKKTNKLSKPNFNVGIFESDVFQPQHLYFTNDEEIKDGYWYLATIFGHGTEETKPLQWSVGTKPCGEQPMGRKIIASTDPKLIKSIEGLEVFGLSERIAKPSQAFIKAYCEQAGFNEVDVEYEVNHVLDLEILDGKTRVKGTIFIPKVDPIHNTVTIHPIVEKMYRLSTIIELLEESRGEFEDSDDKIEWIKENL